ncbi:MAG: bifunctional metallophosphatase/5'-nucleotidase [Putridiphycobacter sp.]
MDRRKFLYTIGSGALTISSLSSFSKQRELDKITILHTNDTHSHIDPFPKNDRKYPNKGGVNRRKALVDKIRSEEKNVLLLDAGDIFQGTPYFNMYGGELEFKVMSQIGYDAATIGNHDFDGSIEGFNRVLPLANFPFLCANYDFSNTILNHKTIPFKIFRKNHLKIGVFGVGVELDGLVSKELYKETQYLDPIAQAQKYATILKQEHKCNLVICLSHLGYYAKQNDMCDTILAKETSDIDLIIGGHTHTFLPKPEMHKNKNGKAVLINQVGWAGIMLGRIDFYFDKHGNPDLWASLTQPNNLEVI